LGSKLVKIRGWDKLVLLVITRNENDKLIALFSTDILLPPERVLQLYSARWKIELAFRELKQFGKMVEYRIRSKEGMTKHVTLCFVAHSLLRLLPFTKIQMHVQPVHRPWYKKAGTTTGQIRTMFQRECMIDTVIIILLYPFFYLNYNY
jgi:transposase